jgi:hypothetical protein
MNSVIIIFFTKGKSQAMTEKTMQGKKCPKCQSFVRDDSFSCAVCGFEWAKKTTGVVADRVEEQRPAQPDHEFPATDTVTCPKCGTGNSGDFRYCKICKHPLQDAMEGPAQKMGRGSGSQLSLNWKVRPSKDVSDVRLDLTGLQPFFIGYAVWNDHAFFVFSRGDGYQILVKKGNTGDSASMLYKKCHGHVMMESGREFYLGAVRFQIRGALSHEGADQTVMRSDKTVLRGPGEKQIPRFLSGKPRLKILGLKPAHRDADITAATPVGRNFLVENFGLDDDELKQNGISKEHIRMTPYPNGKWLIECLADKPVFEEVSEIPLIVNPGDVLRWVDESRMGEFVIQVEEKEA